MRVLSVTLPWIWMDNEKKAAAIAKRRAALESIGIEVMETDDELARSPEYIVTSEQFASLSMAIDGVKIKREIKLHDSLPSILHRVEAVTEKLEQMKGGGSQFNERCDVHMPGNALMSFNVTMLMQDSCTDELQAQMDKGWRIIAACPQPDQRRPDYILGRFDPTHEPSRNGAYRG